MYKLQRIILASLCLSFLSPCAIGQADTLLFEDGVRLVVKGSKLKYTKIRSSVFDIGHTTHTDGDAAVEPGTWGGYQYFKPDVLYASIQLGWRTVELVASYTILKHDLFKEKRVYIAKKYIGTDYHFQSYIRIFNTYHTNLPVNRFLGFAPRFGLARSSYGDGFLLKERKSTKYNTVIIGGAIIKGMGIKYRWRGTLGDKNYAGFSTLFVVFDYIIRKGPVRHDGNPSPATTNGFRTYIELRGLNGRERQNGFWLRFGISQVKNKDYPVIILGGGISISIKSKR